ncbi:MAG: hypothetical protein IKC76_07305, partial [Firmicutes bacterium]|nr:hypothetical protein [Bacillota bacterium]
GTLATETRTYPDGEQGIEHYAEDGTLSALIRHLPDGSYNEEQYADGSIKSSERSLGGRLVQAEYYDAAGRLTESFGLDNYGRPVRRTHHADGSETSRISNPDGSTTQVEHDAAGNVLSSAIVE